MGRQKGRRATPFADVAERFFRESGYSDAEVAQALEVFADEAREYGAPRSEKEALQAAGLARLSMIALGKRARVGG